VSEARFLLDEHLHSALATGLRQRGIDAVTAAEAGRLGMPDEDQLVWAQSVSRVIVTHDRDFLVLARQVSRHAGIAYCRSRKYPVGPLLRRVESLWLQVPAEEWRDRVVFL